MFIRKMKLLSNNNSISGKSKNMPIQSSNNHAKKKIRTNIFIINSNNQGDKKEIKFKFRH